MRPNKVRSQSVYYVWLLGFIQRTIRLSGYEICGQLNLSVLSAIVSLYVHGGMQNGFQTTAHT